MRGAKLFITEGAQAYLWPILCDNGRLEVSLVPLHRFLPPTKHAGQAPERTDGRTVERGRTLQGFSHEWMR